MLIPIANELKQESLQLLRQYQQSPSIALRNKIVQLHGGLVRREAYHWTNHCTESYEDLVQVGSIGLIRAIERFDIAKGRAFSTFAVPYIRGEIQHYLRDKGRLVRLPRQWYDLQHQVSKTLQILQMELNRQPTDREVAEALQLSVTEWQEIKLAYCNRVPLSLDTPIYGEDEDVVSVLGDTIPDSRYQSFQLAQEDRIRLHQVLLQLEDRVRKVMEFVFLQEMSQKETAQHLGISTVTVARRLKQGLQAMQRNMH